MRSKPEVLGQVVKATKVTLTAAIAAVLLSKTAGEALPRDVGIFQKGNNIVLEDTRTGVELTLLEDVSGFTEAYFRSNTELIIATRLSEGSKQLISYEIPTGDITVLNLPNSIQNFKLLSVNNNYAVLVDYDSWRVIAYSFTEGRVTHISNAVVGEFSVEVREDELRITSFPIRGYPSVVSQLSLAWEAQKPDQEP